MSRPALALRTVDPIEAHDPDLRIGDIVCTGNHQHPRYEVVAISGEGAWVRNVQYGDDHVVPIASLHRI